MPSLFKLHPVAPLPTAEPTASERFTLALVALTRTVWHPACTFETAVAAICKAAAEALRTERVSVWQYEPAVGRLRCLCAYDLNQQESAAPESLETLSLDGDDYMIALKHARTFNAADVDIDPRMAHSHSALREYLQRHRIHALLDAPAFVEGELQGVICHESVNRVRDWTTEEITFAASMGDYVAMAYEIARRRRAEAEVEHLRLHDANTGLPNRDYLVELVRLRLDGARRRGEALAIVHVLIDTRGGLAWSASSPTVEEVMARIAERLRRLSDDTVELARVRQNGFAFLVARNMQQRSVIRLAERALAAIRALEFDHDEVDPSAAVGIAFAAGADDDARVLMRQAEEAAEHARTGDKYTYEVFDTEHHDTLVEGLRFERALRDAFAAGQFEVHYQPEYDAHDREWVAAESLLRWRDGGRLVVAGEFIGVVESSGLMLPVGRWVLRQACLDAVDWPLTPSGKHPAVRVNVSARQFDEDGLVDDVTAALVESGLDPARLCLELTETTLMRDIEHALEVLKQLKALGVQVAIDDFGTGYASLVYLKRLPIDVLKIDRSFVEGMPGATADTAIVKAVVGLADSLGIDVIAEGVERVAQQQALRDIGVRRMQGWLYGKAMDQLSIRTLLGESVSQ